MVAIKAQNMAKTAQKRGIGRRKTVGAVVFKNAHQNWNCFGSLGFENNLPLVRREDLVLMPLWVDIFLNHV